MVSRAYTTTIQPPPFSSPLFVHSMRWPLSSNFRAAIPTRTDLYFLPVIGLLPFCALPLYTCSLSVRFESTATLGEARVKAPFLYK